MADSDSVDVAIVGAGTAGLTALREVRRRTDRFVIVNAGAYGTTCARVGCMPSKALIAAANAFHARTRLAAFGVRGADALEVDIPAVLRRVRSLRDRFVAGVLKATEGLGTRSIAGHARLDGPNRLIVGERAIHADRIILAPGSSPVVPGPWQALGERILTSDTLFEQETLPARIGVIGLGPLGIEIALALARLGCEVHGFDSAETIAGISDRKVADSLRDSLARELSLHLGAKVSLSGARGAIEIRWENASVVVDRIIAAVGRRPNVGDLGLETLGVPLDSNGMPEVDPTTMRVGATPVFLAGDANGDRPVLHEAADEGHIAGLNAMSKEPIRLRRRTSLGVVFSDPEVAFVGRRAKDLDRGATLIGEASFVDQGRARIMQANQGLLRLYATRREGRLLGAEMACPAAGHLAHLLALAIDRGMSVHDVLRMPFYHPTIEEGLRTALRGIAQELPPCGPSDLAGCGPLGIEALD